MTSHHMFDSWDKNLQKSRFSKKKKFPPKKNTPSLPSVLSILKIPTY